MPEPGAPSARLLRRAGTCGLVLWLIAACGPPTLEIPPLELRAKWQTDAPGYDGRYFEIGFDALVWKMGRTELARHAIKEIEVVPQGRGSTPAYRFHYTETEGYANSLVVHLVSPDPRRIRLGSRKEEWTPIDE